MTRRLAHFSVATLMVPLFHYGIANYAHTGDGEVRGGTPCTPMRLVAETKDGAGASWYEFRDTAGQVTEQVIPPASFHPLTATLAELRRYHFGDRPTDPIGLATWREQYRNFKGFAEPGICVVVGRSNGSNSSWSGIEQQKHF